MSMKPATVHEIKKALATVPPDRMLELLMRLAKYKKDNKELLTYMLFEADDEEAYIAAIKSEMDELFPTINRYRIFYIKKTLRKILRFIDKFIRYSGKKETEADIRIYFCEKIMEDKIPITRSRVLTNMYNGQLKKINVALSKLHEDIQYDYQSRLEEIK